ncbi:MAG: hypothetical protein PHH26_07330 [Candidatus Thermoplasmatota archaeon]|jgi:hypothetical protein|nr:hypothetical protein [Candidatus Thermoplasmatota archaeon]
MSKLERIICVAAPNIMGVILVIMGKRVISQACVVTTTISPAAVMMGAMLICTGLICVSLSCIAYALVRPSVKVNDNN